MITVNNSIQPKGVSAEKMQHGKFYRVVSANTGLYKPGEILFYFDGNNSNQAIIKFQNATNVASWNKLSDFSNDRLFVEEIDMELTPKSKG